MSANEIEIHGITYKVEVTKAGPNAEHPELPRYVLTGPRGAKYATMRNRSTGDAARESLWWVIDLYVRACGGSPRPSRMSERKKVAIKAVNEAIDEVVGQIIEEMNERDG